MTEPTGIQTDVVQTFQPQLGVVDESEVLRYSRMCERVPELAGVVSEAISEVSEVVDARVCYLVRPCEVEESVVKISGASLIESRSLSLALSGCNHALLMGATAGLGIDRLLARYGRLEPTKALFVQATGAERIEAICDAFCSELGRRLESMGYLVRPRFSPGYGDFALSYQAELFRLLDLPRKIGLTLTGSMLMSPTKSVTAIAGILRKE